MRKAWIVLPALLSLLSPAARPGVDPAREGIRLLREGKAEKARRLLEQAKEALGKAKKEPPPELLYDLGVAALRSGKEGEAKTAFLEALVRAGGKKARLEALSGWGLGAALWRLAGKAEKAGPAGLDQALKLLEEARDAWIRALLKDPSLAPLGRNIERANRKIEELKKRKKEREKQKKEQRKKNPKKNREKEKNRKSREKNKPGEKKRKKDGGEKKKKENPSSGKKKEKNKKPEGGREKEKKRPPAGKKKGLSRKERRKLAMSPEQVKKLMDELKKMEKERILLEKARVRARGKGGKGW